MRPGGCAGGGAVCAGAGGRGEEAAVGTGGLVGALGLEPSALGLVGRGLVGAGRGLGLVRWCWWMGTGGCRAGARGWALVNGIWQPEAQRRVGDSQHTFGRISAQGPAPLHDGMQCPTRVAVGSNQCPAPAPHPARAPCPGLPCLECSLLNTHFQARRTQRKPPVPPYPLLPRRRAPRCC